MITDFFIDLINSIINSIPDMPSFITNSYSQIYTIFNTVNYYVPIKEFLLTLTSYMVLVKWKVGVRLIKWLLDHINIG